LKDPVTGFVVPEEWLELCPDPEALQKVRSGRWVLLSDGALLRRGITTGTTAAAACKGAILSLVRSVSEVEVPTPVGIRLRLPVQGLNGGCRAVKDSGDHQFDITNGLEIEARARSAKQTDVVPGQGIGLIARGGLCAEQGKPAISQSARRQIREAIQEGLEETGLEGAVVELCIPRGKETAAKTLNPQVGVQDGLSVLGSTGFVEPWNEHLGQDVTQGLDEMKRVVATTGRIGLKFSRILFPHHQAVLVGSHLDRLNFTDEQDSVLCGLPGMILKWSMPEMLEGTGYATVAEMVELEPDHPALARALERARIALPNTRIVLINRDGSIFMEAEP